MKWIGIAIVGCALLAGCQSYQPKEAIELTRNAIEAARAGNVAGTLRVHIEGAGEVWASQRFGIGNPHTILDANLQFKFDKDAR